MSPHLFGDNSYSADNKWREIIGDQIDDLSPLESEGQLLRQRLQKNLAKLPLHLPLRLPLRSPPIMGIERRIRRRSGLKLKAWMAARVM